MQGEQQLLRQQYHARFSEICKFLSDLLPQNFIPIAIHRLPQSTRYLATWVPCRRASRIEPMQALRTE
jgi:ABC-type lipoprotein release transport system permease subunit